MPTWLQECKHSGLDARNTGHVKAKFEMQPLAFRTTHPNTVTRAGPTGSPSWLGLTLKVAVASTLAGDRYVDGVTVSSPSVNTPCSQEGRAGGTPHKSLVPDFFRQARPLSQVTVGLRPVASSPHTSPFLATRGAGTARFILAEWWSSCRTTCNPGAPAVHPWDSQLSCCSAHRTGCHLSSKLNQLHTPRTCRCSLSKLSRTCYTHSCRCWRRRRIQGLHTTNNGDAWHHVWVPLLKNVRDLRMRSGCKLSLAAKICIPGQRKQPKLSPAQPPWCQMLHVATQSEGCWPAWVRDSAGQAGQAP